MKNNIVMDGENTIHKTKKYLILFTAAAFFTAGCESIPDLPDAVNPMSWFTDDEKPVAAGQTDSAKPYPNLKSVPERPKRPSLSDQQARISQGLMSDSKNARYTDAQIRKEVQKRTTAPAVRSQPPVVQPAIVQPARPASRPVAPPPVRMAPPKVAPAPAPPARRITPPAIQRPALAAAPLAAAPKAMPDSPTPQVAKGLFKIGTIYFADGSTVVQRGDAPILQQIAGAQRQSGGSLEIIGHASGRVKTFDPVRRSRINHEVSLRRAKSVGAALVGLGVPVSQIRMDGAGDSKQLYAEYTAAGEAANRRVEIFLRQ
jgi:outer membrane protein OmpA-like peptidoglycan-associated protein